MASLQRSIGRAITVKGLNKKQARFKRTEIKERKLLEKKNEREVERCRQSTN